jgi:predicted deacylase
VHGDEMSSIQTVQTVMTQLNPAAMSGTVMAVTDISRPALEGMQRRWPNSGRGIDLIDMNREWPGTENGPTASGRHAWLVFNRLLRPNADYAIDFHTGTTGFGVTDFNIGEMSVAEIRAMLELYPVSQIADNPTYPGVLHNAFIDAGIPSFLSGGRRRARPRSRADRTLRRRHDERPQASRDRGRSDGSHQRGRARLRRQCLVPHPRHRGRDRGTPRPAQ